VRQDLKISARGFQDSPWAGISVKAFPSLIESSQILCPIRLFPFLSELSKRSSTI
jgi:hypothetical protein